MGKWATYRKRGTDAGISRISPPPPPVLSIQFDDLIVTTASASNLGGSFDLQYAAAPDEWESLDSYPWQSLPLELFEVDELDPGDYRVKESGNGTDYLGDSPWSNTITV